MNPVRPATAALRDFRDDFYGCLSRRTEALFELTDALPMAGPSPSPVHLSRDPVHHRGWVSFYAALRRGTAEAGALRAPGPPPGGRRVVGRRRRLQRLAALRRGDEPRPRLLRPPVQHSAGQPIVAGWVYQWLAQFGLERDGWTAPLDVRRVHPTENANAVTVGQIPKACHARDPTTTHQKDRSDLLRIAALISIRGAPRRALLDDHLIAPMEPCLEDHRPRCPRASTPRAGRRRRG